MTRSLSLFALACAFAAGTAACSGAPPGTEGSGPVGSTSEALSGNDAVARGAEWVAAQVPYCQSPNGQPDPDPACSSICMRPSNPAWDPYRSDCSGFVSWAWGLPPPGRTTSELAPAVTDITQVIDGNSLLPGDALNIPGDHMVLFVAWNVVGQNATFYEEPGCSVSMPYAHAFTSNVTISGSSVSVDYEGKTFTAIRYDGLTGTVDDGGAPDTGGTSCFVPSLGESGQCMLTTDCAALGNHVSTPGYCPGPNDIECCTAIPGSDAGTTNADSGADTGSQGMGAPDAGTDPMQGDSGAASYPREDSGAGAPVPAQDAGMDDAGTNAYGASGLGPSSGACSVTHSARSGSGVEIVLAGLSLVATRRRRQRRRDA